MGSPGRKIWGQPDASALNTMNEIIGHHSLRNNARIAIGTVPVVSV